MEMRTLNERMIEAASDRAWGWGARFGGPLGFELEFTRRYRAMAGEHKARREAECLAWQFEYLFRPVEAGDLIAGRVVYPLVGFSIEPGGLGYYFREQDVAAVAAEAGIAGREDVREMIEFWREENTASRCRATFPEWVKSLLPSDGWTTDREAAYPLYRVAGLMLDNAKLCRLGLGGLEAEVREKLVASADPEARALGDAALSLLGGIRRTALRYASDAADEALAGALRAVAMRAPATMREGAQLIWLYTLHAGTWNHGRLDTVLGPLLGGDLRAGRETEASAVEFLASWWRVMKAYENQYNNRVVVGGVGRGDDTADADRFALLAIEATRRVRLNQPQLTLRFHKAQDPALFDRALDAIGEGCTFPMLYNDEVNVPAMAAAFGVSRAEAEQYLPFGCGEAMLDHRAVTTPNAVINLLKCLESAIDTLESPGGIEEVWSAYDAVVRPLVAAGAAAQEHIYRETAAQGSIVLASLLTDDCMARGRSLLDGGVRYRGGTFETYGNTDVADSLTAIEHAVFRDGRCTWGQLKAALRDDYRGHESLREVLKGCPKYGNDDDAADRWAVRVHDHVCTLTRDAARPAGLDCFLVVVINNWANVILGQQTGASAEGRNAGEMLANANNPYPGADRAGVTATLNSLVKLRADHHAGAVQNMKFAPSLFKDHRPKVKKLLETYFARGGTQAMITVVRKADMEAAIREPGKWGHLMVRVGGFSARFIDLPPQTQRELIARTSLAE